MRLTSTAVSALAIGLLLSSTARADEERSCKAVNAKIVTSFVACTPEFPAGIGLCTQGTVDSGLLKGTTRFSATSLDLTTGRYTGVLVITTRKGTVTLHDAGALTPAGFSEVQVIVSGTGKFRNASGILNSQGIQTLTGFSGTLTGVVCKSGDREGDHEDERD
jgi:hypothetical protein